LAHREGQIKIQEARLGTLAAQNEALTSTIAKRNTMILTV
jgi:hypothetical protein